MSDSDAKISELTAKIAVLEAALRTGSNLQTTIEQRDYRILHMKRNLEKLTPPA